VSLGEQARYGKKADISLHCADCAFKRWMVFIRKSDDDDDETDGMSA